MNKLKSIITILFCALMAGTVFAGGPTFVVEESGAEYIMYLRIDDASSIETIVVEGDYSKNGETDVMALSFSSSQLSTEGVSMAEIQTLNDEYDYASYVVRVLDTEGNILEYPAVHVSMSDMASTN